MNNRVRALIAFPLLIVTLAMAEDYLTDFRGKWTLEKSEESFHPTAPMRTVGPAASPMGGGDVDVRTGGEGSYRGGEGPSPQNLKNFSPNDLVVAIDQTETEIKFERKWTQDDQPMVSHEELALDGKESIVRNSAGKVESKSKAKLRKGCLIIERIHQVPAGGRTVEVRAKQELSLSQDGQVLNIKTTQELPSGQILIKQTFKKSRV
jgi:hypothetical protein